MKVFITGAGLIGCHAARELTEQGHAVSLWDANPDPRYVAAIAGERRVRVLRGDLLDLPDLLRTMKQVRPDVVVHTAGLIGSQVESPPYRGFQTNTVGSVNVFEACQLFSVKRLVHVSTFGVYDWENIRRGPVKEDFPRWGTRFYPATKVANEVLLGAYENFYGMECVRIRPAGVYGPGHYRGGSGGGKNMDALIRACVSEAPITLNETQIGHNDFVYAKDVGQGVTLACVAKGAAGKAFNIGTGEIYGAQDFLHALRRLLPKRNITIVKAPGTRSRSRIRIDLSQAREILRYAPRYPLEKGLKDYMDSAKRNGFWT